MTSIYPSTTSSNTSSSTSSSKLLRISGMASGIDTDAVVKSMVSNYQSKIDKANQAEQTVQWKQDAYRDIIKDIKGLQDYFDPLSSKYIMSGNTLNINTATSDDSSIVSATPGSTAKSGTYKVKVSKLAEQARITGNPLNSMVDVTNTDLSTWSKAKFAMDITDTNGNTTTKTITLDSIALGATGEEVVANINSKIAANSNFNGKVLASYVDDGTNKYIKFTKTGNDVLKLSATTNTEPENNIFVNKSINNGISSSTKLSDLGIDGDMSFDLAYDSKTSATPIHITATSSDTLQDLMDKVNSSTDGAVTMSIDDTTGKISFQSKNYGSASNITIKNNTSNLSKLNIVGGTTQTGKDAIVAITAPGETTATTTTQSSNKFTVNGVTYNIAGVNQTNETSNITVTANSDTVVSNMKKFIDDYNSVITKINTKLTEKKNTDYKPLTDAQKESMSETQINAWESKAKVGILKNDDYLNTLLTQLRGAFSPVYNSYDGKDSSSGKISLSFGAYGANAIGIDTTSDYTDGGKLVIKDETKLKSAIENNIDDFKKLFIGASDSTLDTNQSYSGSKKYKEDGIFKRMDTILRDYVSSPGIGKDGTYTLSGSLNIFVNKQYDYTSSGSGGKNTLPDQVYAQTVNITKYKKQLSAAETRYYAKFTALETAMNTLNSQQSQLSSMLGTS